eukprot:4994286-Pleurochrysis_carterae.AAC.1
MGETVERVGKPAGIAAALAASAQTRAYPTQEGRLQRAGTRRHNGTERLSRLARSRNRRTCSAIAEAGKKARALERLARRQGRLRGLRGGKGASEAGEEGRA